MKGTLSSDLYDPNSDLSEVKVVWCEWLFDLDS